MTRCVEMPRSRRPGRGCPGNGSVPSTSRVLIGADDTEPARGHDDDLRQALKPRALVCREHKLDVPVTASGPAGRARDAVEVTVLVAAPMARRGDKPEPCRLCPASLRRSRAAAGPAGKELRMMRMKVTERLTYSGHAGRMPSLPSCSPSISMAMREWRSSSFSCDRI